MNWEEMIDNWINMEQQQPIQLAIQEAYWQHYRTEAAIAAMQGLLSNEAHSASASKIARESGNYGSSVNVLAGAAVEFADALIKELELPVEPKFKAEDRIVRKSDKSTIYHIITLHEQRREYIVEIEHKDYHESCQWIAFEDQDNYELAPKPHYDIKNFKAGMPVLVRATSGIEWMYTIFSHFREDCDHKFNAGCYNWYQCIPYEGNEHLLGTTDMPSEEFINW